MFVFFIASSRLKLPIILLVNTFLISGKDGTTLEYSPKWYTKSKLSVKASSDCTVDIGEYNAPPMWLSALPIE